MSLPEGTPNYQANPYENMTHSMRDVLDQHAENLVGGYVRDMAAGRAETHSLHSPELGYIRDQIGTALGERQTRLNDINHRVIPATDSRLADPSLSATERQVLTDHRARLQGSSDRLEAQQQFSMGAFRGVLKSTAHEAARAKIGHADLWTGDATTPSPNTPPPPQRPPVPGRRRTSPLPIAPLPAQPRRPRTRLERVSFP